MMTLKEKKEIQNPFWFKNLNALFSFYIIKPVLRKIIHFPNSLTVISFT